MHPKWSSSRFPWFTGKMPSGEAGAQLFERLRLGDPLLIQLPREIDKLLEVLIIFRRRPHTALLHVETHTSDPPRASAVLKLPQQLSIQSIAVSGYVGLRTRKLASCDCYEPLRPSDPPLIHVVGDLEESLEVLFLLEGRRVVDDRCPPAEFTDIGGDTRRPSGFYSVGVDLTMSVQLWYGNLTRAFCAGVMPRSD